MFYTNNDTVLLFADYCKSVGFFYAGGSVRVTFIQTIHISVKYAL